LQRAHILILASELNRQHENRSTHHPLSRANIDKSLQQFMVKNRV